jgi:hypothetical protein
MVRVGYEGYAPGSEVTLVFVDFSDMVERPIGQGTAARDGTGRIAGVVPPDSTIGQAELQIVSGECWSHVYFVVIGSPETMRVDDATVVPGQRVTVTARGFQPDSRAFITIDTYPTQGECWPHPCRQLGTFAQSSEDGTVVIHIRIPSDVTPGVHGLFATGYSPDGISDYTVGTQITVVPTGTLPPTDTEEAA